jgi:hypothetical protein
VRDARWAPILGVLLAAAFAIEVRPASSSTSRTIPCREVIDHPAFPYNTGDPKYRYRLVLDAVSVPPAFQRQVVATRERPWAYWRKAGIVVRGGTQVTIAVPSPWRHRLAIIWGNGNYLAASSLRIAACGVTAGVGNAYAGGFYLRAPACVPLTFRVAARAETVRFGIGKRCP